MAVDILATKRANELADKLRTATNTIDELNKKINKLNDDVVINHGMYVGAQAQLNIQKLEYEAKIRDLVNQNQAESLFYEQQGLDLSKTQHTLETLNKILNS